MPYPVQGVQTVRIIGGSSSSGGGNRRNAICDFFVNWAGISRREGCVGGRYGDPVWHRHIDRGWSRSPWSGCTITLCCSRSCSQRTLLFCNADADGDDCNQEEEATTHSTTDSTAAAGTASTVGHGCGRGRALACTLAWLAVGWTNADLAEVGSEHEHCIVSACCTMAGSSAVIFFFDAIHAAWVIHCCCCGGGGGGGGGGACNTCRCRARDGRSGGN